MSHVNPVGSSQPVALNDGVYGCCKIGHYFIDCCNILIYFTRVGLNVAEVYMEDHHVLHIGLHAIEVAIIMEGVTTCLKSVAGGSFLYRNHKYLIPTRLGCSDLVIPMWSFVINLQLVPHWTLMRGIQLDQSHGLSARSIICVAFTVVGSTFDIQVKVGHDPFYSSIGRPKVKARGIPYLDAILWLYHLCCYFV